MIGSRSAIISSGVIGAAPASSGCDLAVLAHERRHARRQVQVRRLRFDHQAEQPIDRRRCRPERRRRCTRCRGCAARAAGRRDARRPARSVAARCGARPLRDWIRHDAHGDLRSVAQDRDLERAARRRVIEFHRVSCGRRRRACSGTIGPTSCRISCRVSGWLDASCVAPAASRIFAGLPTARRRPWPTCRSSSSTCLRRRSRFFYLGQRHDVRGVDQQRAIRRARRSESARRCARSRSDDRGRADERRRRDR